MPDETTAAGRHAAESSAAAKVVPAFILSVRDRGEAGYEVTATRLREKEILYLDQPIGTFPRLTYLDVGHVYQRFFETKLQDEGWQEEYVHTLGVELWFRLPREVRRYYREEMRGLAGNASVLVVTEPGVPSFPWELVRPRRVIGGGTDEFLGHAFAIGHWTAGLRWRLLLEVSRFAAMTTEPDDTVAAALAVLTATGTEPADQQLAGILDLLTNFTAATYGFASVRNLVSLLRVDDPATAPEIIHVATHGSADELGGPTLRIALDSTSSLDLTPGLVQAHARLGDADRHPLVFLNACEAGANGLFPGARSDSWATAFCEAGSAALVAPRWVVGRKAAREAALRFYQELRDGRTAGQALQTLRATFYDKKGDPLRAAWLAYTLHGHPDLTVGLGGA